MWGAPLLNRWLGGSRPVPTRQARREPPPEGRPTPAPAKARGADAAPDPRRPRRAPDLQPARPNTDPAITRPGSFPAASAKWRTRHPAPNRLPQRRSEARAAALSGHTRPPRTSGAQPATPPRRPPEAEGRPSRATANRPAAGDPGVQTRAQAARLRRPPEAEGKSQPRHHEPPSHRGPRRTRPGSAGTRTAPRTQRTSAAPGGRAVPIRSFGHWVGVGAAAAAWEAMSVRWWLPSRVMRSTAR